MLQMVAVVGVLRRRQLTALLAPRAATPAAVALLASRGGGGGSFTDFSQAYRGAAEHPEQYHHVPLDDGPHERACSPAAAQQAERMRAQTALLIEAGDYRPRVGEPAARCRSDAAPAAPLPHLRSAAVLFSRKRRPPAGVTVVTQLSLERLAMLERQCRCDQGVVRLCMLERAKQLALGRGAVSKHFRQQPPVYHTVRAGSPSLTLSHL